MEISRKSFLVGFGGMVVGVPLGMGAQRGWVAREPEAAPPNATAAPPEPKGLLSFSQCGEDLIADFILKYLKTEDVSFLDVGAHDPVLLNNTFYFHRQGHRGVLIEPNVAMCEKLRAARPGDTVLEAGIGVTAEREADFYLMSESSWSTFSKEEAEKMVETTNGRITIQKILKMPLLDINEVMAKHFGGAPTFVSIDAEGLHAAILRSIDFERFRPNVICVETLVAGRNDVISEIPAFMQTKGYVDRGRTFVNTIFVDSRLL